MMDTEIPNQSNDGTPAAAPIWPEVVKGTEMLRKIETLFTRYAVLPREGISLVLASWALSTWTLDAFDTHPLLAITSPEKRCGKSRLLELLYLVCCEPIPAANMSTAALYRMVSDSYCTLLVDEAQNLRRRDDRSAALMEILCASYRRHLAQVIRMGGPQMNQVIKFKAFGPKVFALIGKLSDTLADRSIEVRMRRRAPDEQIRHFHFEHSRVNTDKLRKQIRRWSMDSLEKVRESYRQIDRPAGLEDRDAELWAPLFAIVTVADPARLLELEEMAKGLAAIKANEDSSLGIRLLRDIWGVFKVCGARFVSTKELVEELVKLEDAPWSDLRNGKALSPTGLARFLKAFGIAPSRVRQGKAIPRGYSKSDFFDAWKRYAHLETLGEQDGTRGTIHIKGLTG